jgi:hypothetical protein
LAAEARRTGRGWAPVAFGGAGTADLVVAAASLKSENLLLPEEFSRKIAAKVLV